MGNCRDVGYIVTTLRSLPVSFRGMAYLCESFRRKLNAEFKEARKGRKPCELEELGKLGETQVNLSSVVLTEGGALRCCQTLGQGRAEWLTLWERAGGAGFTLGTTDPLYIHG